MTTRQFIDFLAAGESAAAKETLENVISAKAFEALDDYKKQIAQSLFGGNQISEETISESRIKDIKNKLQEETLDNLTEDDVYFLESLDDENLQLVTELSSDHVLTYVRKAARDAGSNLVRGNLGKVAKRFKGIKKATSIYGSKSNERGQFTSKHGTTRATRVDNIGQLAGHSKFKN